jgi:hypothetical protein
MSTLFVMKLDLRDFFLLRAEEIIVRTGRKKYGRAEIPIPTTSWKISLSMHTYIGVKVCRLLRLPYPDHR